MQEDNRPSELCAVCKKNEAEQSHHISYEPEIEIDVCIPCHMKLHKHGVGTPKGLHLPSEMEPEPVFHYPTYTEEIIKDNLRTIVLISDKEVLDQINCPNGCGPVWQVFQSPKLTQDLAWKNHLFLRCPHCGYDTVLTRLLEEK